jgi:hypothetical protein
MKSFKTLSIATAAALAIGTMVSVAPANAATTLTVNSVAAVGGTTAVAPVTIPVPDQNNVLVSKALTIVVDSLANNSVVTASATNGKILTTIGTSTLPVAASAGSASASVNTGSGTTATFYVFTTSTSAGSVVVTVGGTSTTYYFQGGAGALNAITMTTPDTGAAGTTQKVVLAGYDVFGNAVSGASINLQVITSTASVTTAYTTESSTTSTTTLGAKTVDVLVPTSGTLTLVATATVAGSVTGLASPIGVAVKTVAIRDLATELASVQAQLAAEKAGRAADKAASDAAAAKALTDAATAKAAADLAKATYIKEYNALAKKWNAKNPRAKVTLKK